MEDQIRLFEEATYAEMIAMSDEEIQKLKADLSADKKALQDEADEIEKLLAMINIRDGVKKNGRAA